MDIIMVNQLYQIELTGLDNLLPRDCIAWHLHIYLITTPLNNSEANKINAIKIMKLIVAAPVNMQ
jgi:hypothetical protein